MMNLKELRHKANKRAEEVAVLLDISISTVRNWEQGRTIPKLRIDQFEKLCKIYNCSFELLVIATKNTAK